MANPFQLAIAETGKPIELWACGICNTIPGMTAQSRDDADKCCRCGVCGEVMTKEEQRDMRYTHRRCWDRRNDERREADKQERLRNSEVVSTFDGPAYIDELDSYFSDLGEAQDALDGEDLECEGVWAWSCNTIPVLQPGFEESAIENATVDAFEEAEYHLDGLEEFEAAANALVERNKDVCSWEVNWKQRVWLPHPGGSQ